MDILILATRHLSIKLEIPTGKDHDARLLRCSNIFVDSKLAIVKPDGELGDAWWPAVVSDQECRRVTRLGGWAGGCDNRP